MRLLDRKATDKEDVRHMTRGELDSLGIAGPLIGVADPD